MLEKEKKGKNIGIYTRVDTPCLIKQIFDNPGTGMLRIPFNTVLKFLGAVAQRAAELNDPELNILMIKLNLYEVDNKEASKLIDQCMEEMKICKKKHNKKAKK